METPFDLIQGLQASILDSTQLELICEQQRTLTMHRIAGWLRGNAKLFQYFPPIENDVMAQEVNSLAEDLEYMANFSSP